MIIRKDIDVETRTARFIGNGDNVRTIDLNDAALRALAKLHIETLMHDAKIFDVGNYYERFKAAVKKAGLEHLDLTWHDL